MAVKQIFAGYGAAALSCLQGSPYRPAECFRNRDLTMRYVRGGLMLLSGDDADVRERIRHAVSVSPMLVNTAVLYVTKSRQKSNLRGFCAMAMSMSGEVVVRERRTATAARVCPRRTAAIPPSAARTAGFAVNDDGG